MIDLVDAPAAESARPSVAEEWAQLEHRHGVLPLLGAFFERGAVDQAVANATGALALFTPAPEPGWEAAAVDGEPAGDGVLLRGDLRLPGPAADGSLVLVRMGAGEEIEHRLAWIDHGAPGIERRASRTGGPGTGDGPVWLHLDGIAVAPGFLSRPVTLAPDGELAGHLTAYAGVWAAAAVRLAREGIHALRRAARVNTHRGTAFNASQLVALGLSEVEIEADLAFAAVQRGRGLAVAAAAARTLAAVAAKTEELRDLGLEIDGPFTAGSTKNLTAFLGGQLLLENELARTLGIGPNPGGETHA